ncbi:TPA: hypothetical protein DEO28_02240 [Candidatus Dependentiae bacterium]|nr:MAG: hypothetical protein UR14_C0009G0005 [candidate division TM6 bacterium GW2011_GWE2_31_21]KKP52554.1 MAG: hypothetical protein UR43_C0012G0023 [candidate division TM6 bacterium GW2011_GWF2_33_332]HBS48460.1 hypothetical protein [Candidatus Dependentiae bacterium]HBZ73309.1 hypothetical protein [Candidatus Dependentiae bacterium]
MKKIAVVFYTFFISVFLNSEIKKISSFLEATDALQKATSQTIVAFDCDETIITSEPTVNFFHHPLSFALNDILFMLFELTKMSMHSIYSNNIYQLNSIYAQLTFMGSKVLINTKYIPMEEEIIKIIKDLQTRKITTIALTDQPAKSFGCIPDMGEWRYKKLCDCEINFSEQFSSEKIVFTKFKSKWIYGQPTFYKGLLMSAGQNKGKVLGEYLDILNSRYKKIIFFDDKESNCINVENEAKKRNIPCLCFWYGFGKNQRKNKLNHEYIKFQLNFLKKYYFFINQENVGNFIKVSKQKSPIFQPKLLLCS